MSKNKPKRPLTAYNLFFLLERERVLLGIENQQQQKSLQDHSCCLLPISRDDLKRISRLQKLKSKRVHRKSHGLISFGDLARVVALRWKSLDAESKRLCYEQARVEGEEFHHDSVVQCSSSEEQDKNCAADDDSETKNKNLFVDTAATTSSNAEWPPFLFANSLPSCTDDQTKSPSVKGRVGSACCFPDEALPTPSEFKLSSMSRSAIVGTIDAPPAAFYDTSHHMAPPSFEGHGNDLAQLIDKDEMVIVQFQRQLVERLQSTTMTQQFRQGNQLQSHHQKKEEVYGNEASAQYYECCHSKDICSNTTFAEPHPLWYSESLVGTAEELNKPLDAETLDSLFLED